uniref:Uncharacterized protein n=1 Tax=Ditylenchus dipsaci TaxID=166011 RepID=A0A915DX85_9BILA
MVKVEIESLLKVPTECCQRPTSAGSSTISKMRILLASSGFTLLFVIAALGNARQTTNGSQTITQKSQPIPQNSPKINNPQQTQPALQGRNTPINFFASLPQSQTESAGQSHKYTETVAESTLAKSASLIEFRKNFDDNLNKGIQFLLNKTRNEIFNIRFDTDHTMEQDLIRISSFKELQLKLYARNIMDLHQIQNIFRANRGHLLPESEVKEFDNTFNSQFGKYKQTFQDCFSALNIIFTSYFHISKEDFDKTSASNGVSPLFTTAFNHLLEEKVLDCTSVMKKYRLWSTDETQCEILSAATTPAVNINK